MTIYIIRGKNHLLAGKRNFWTEQQLWKGLFLETYMDQNEKIPGSPNVIKLSLPWLTKDTFLLTISIEFQVERLWEIGISSTRGYCFNQHQNDLRVIYILAARRFLSPKWALTLYYFKMIFPCNFLALQLPQETETEFLLTISIGFQEDKWREWKKISTRGSISWFNTKFSKLHNKNCTADSQENY